MSNCFLIPAIASTSPLLPKFEITPIKKVAKLTKFQPIDNLFFLLSYLINLLQSW